jgi:D-alanyl-D-alanine carboxypeptidase
MSRFYLLGISVVLASILIVPVQAPANSSDSRSTETPSYMVPTQHQRRGGSLAALPDVSRTIDLQAKLNRKVAANKGYGGGVFRITSAIDGVHFWGASGQLYHGSDQEILPEDTFDIASITKTVTAVAVLQLVDDGLIDLDAPIKGYLSPEITTGLLVIDGHDYGPELTPRQLLNHTCGLPDYWYDPPYVFAQVNAFLLDYYRYPDHFWQPEELLDYARELTPIAVPGITYHYNDTGYVLLGLIVEAVTGRDLHEVYRQRIFEPLDMGDTYLPFHEPAVSLFQESHRYEWHLDMHGKLRQTADWAGGGLVSSARDLEKFLTGLFYDGVLLSPAMLETMRQWIPTDEPDVEYGLGLFRVVYGNGIGELWGHDGYGNSWMYYWPEQQVAFTGTLNQALNDLWSLVHWGMASVLSE